MNRLKPFGEAQNPFAALADEDLIWNTLIREAAARFGITSVLYAFTHSRFVASRVGVTSSLFLKHNLPEDFLAAFPNGLTLDDDIAAELILLGEPEFLWQDFTSRDLRPEQRERYASDCAMGMGVGVSFGFRFGGMSGFGGMCWGKRHESPDNFRRLWDDHQQDMRKLAAQFDAAMRPVMVRNRFRLSPREIDVMSFSAGGMTAKQIAEHLGLAPKTVSNTLERARKSMQAVSTMEAVAKALIYDLIG
jgi:LuxR family transcriptional regulator, quorum-sensing system regulator SdiA